MRRGLMSVLRQSANWSWRNLERWRKSSRWGAAQFAAIWLSLCALASVARADTEDHGQFTAPGISPMARQLMKTNARSWRLGALRSGTSDLLLQGLHFQYAFVPGPERADWMGEAPGWGLQFARFSGEYDRPGLPDLQAEGFYLGLEGTSLWHLYGADNGVFGFSALLRGHGSFADLQGKRGADKDHVLQNTSGLSLGLHAPLHLGSMVRLVPFAEVGLDFSTLSRETQSTTLGLLGSTPTRTSDSAQLVSEFYGYGLDLLVSPFSGAPQWEISLSLARNVVDKNPDANQTVLLGVQYYWGGEEPSSDTPPTPESKSL